MPTGLASWDSAAAAAGFEIRIMRRVMPDVTVAFYGPLADKSDAAPKSSIELAPEIKEPVLGLYEMWNSAVLPLVLSAASIWWT
jgi:hypothetical protein